MDPSSTNREDAISKTLLVIGLLLVAGAIAVYHYAPQFQPGTQKTPLSAADQVAPPEVQVAPAIRGKPAAAFALPNLDGKQVKLADFKGKILLVNFWATWCAPCLLEIPWFLEFQERYGAQGLEVLAISLDEEGPKVVKPFVEKHKMAPFTVVMGDSTTAELFGGLLGLPTTFMVDREGNYYSKHQGLVSKEDVEDDIRSLLEASSTSSPAEAGAAASKPSIAPPPSPKS